MYSLISKVVHSTDIKDAIAVARGLCRIATSQSYDSSQTRSSWFQDSPSLKAYEKINVQSEKLVNHEPIKQGEQRKSNVAKETFIVTQKPIVKSAVPNQKEEIPIIKILKNQSKDQFKKQQKIQIKKQSKTLLSQQGGLQGRERKESEVISSRFGRLFQYGKLGKQLLEIQVEAYVARNLGKGNQQEIYERGAHKITEQLCKMRGAPLKVAQVLSIQQDNLIPAPIRRAFQKAREQAHVMPEKQVNFALSSILGEEWRNKFGSFDIKPFAAASIGQVHKATSLKGQQLAVKLQYPGVERSIQSDIKNLKLLLRLPGVLPKGIFLDKLLANTQKQLKEQCDYLRESKMQVTYDQCLKLVMGNQYERFGIPKIYGQLTEKGIMTSEFLRGVGVGKFQGSDIEQSVRDEVGRLLMKLTFSEIFEMGIMQSDPNPSNFTYNIKAQRLNLFDFGATHIYQKDFMKHYCDIIHASVRQDHKNIIESSVHAGFLTRQQNMVMLQKHVESILTLGDPLRQQGIYDFGSQKITQKIYRTIPHMLKNRLKAPPEQIYSLHRKLSGAYLACIRMKSRVNCHKIYQDLQPGYRIQALL